MKNETVVYFSTEKVKVDKNELTISFQDFSVTFATANNPSYAKRIVKAVNMHDELVEALKMAKWYAMQYHGEKSNTEQEAIRKQNADEDYQKILKLLKQVE